MPRRPSTWPPPRDPASPRGGPATIDAVGFLERRFVPEAELGAGVVLARDRLTATSAPAVVVKTATTIATVAALINEVAELERLDHPALRRVLAHATRKALDGRGSGAKAIAVLEYCPGERLGPYLERHGDDAAACAKSVLRALVHMHARGRVHGDLKPDNIVVEGTTSGPRVRLIDLGLMVPIGAPVRGGTPGFLPPEYRTGGLATVAADLYSFGATFRSAQPTQGANRDEDRAMARMIEACLAPEPASRPASADGALAMLGAMPRSGDRQGEPLRRGDRDLVSSIRAGLGRFTGESFAVEGGRFTGRTRLLRDIVRTLPPGVVHASIIPLAGGADPLPGLGDILLGARPEDDRVWASQIAARAAAAGLVLLFDDVDRASPRLRRLLPWLALSLATFGRGGLVAAGVPADLAAALADVHARAVALARLTPADVEDVLRELADNDDPEMVAAIFAASEGRAALIAWAGRELARRPELGAGALAQLCLERLRQNPDLPEGGVSPPESDSADDETGEPSRPGRSDRRGEVSPIPPSAATSPGSILAAARARARQGDLGGAVELLGAALAIEEPPSGALSSGIGGFAEEHLPPGSEVPEVVPAGGGVAGRSVGELGGASADEGADDAAVVTIMWLEGARWLERLGDYRRAHTWASTALDRTRTVGDHRPRSGPATATLADSRAPVALAGADAGVITAAEHDALGTEIEDHGGSMLQQQAALLVAQSALALGDPLAARAVARAALSLPREDGSTGSGARSPIPGAPDHRAAVAMTARLHALLSDVALSLGDPQAALASADEALALVTTTGAREGDPTLAAHVLARRAGAHALGGAARKAREDYLQAYGAARRAGDVVGLGPHLLNLATAEHAAGELGAAIEHYQRAASLARRLGRRATQAAAMTNWATLLVFVGALDEARRVLEDAREAAHSAQSAIYEAQCDMIGAELAAKCADGDAVALARRAAASFAACQAGRQALEANLLTVELIFTAGETGEDAVRVAEDALRFAAHNAVALDGAGLAARADLLAARARQAIGETVPALEHAERAADRAQADGDDELVARALAHAARIHNRLGTGASNSYALRAQEALGRVASRLPEGLRERFLADPTRRVATSFAPEPHPEPTVRSNQLDPTGRRLLALVRRLLLEGSEGRILEASVDEALDLSGAERALLLRRRGRGKPYVAVARHLPASERQHRDLRFSRSVAERVLVSGKAVRFESAAVDPAVDGVRSIYDLGLLAVLCVPIRAPSGVVGALYLDTRRSTVTLGEAEEEAAQALADIIGVTLENTRLRREMSEKAEELERANRAISRESDERAAEVERLSHAVGNAHEDGGRTDEIAPGIVGRSVAMVRAVDLATRVAKSDLPVLVEGPSGTGKELIARLVHRRSLRAERPLLALNCGAMPDNLLESELFGHLRGAFTGASRDHLGVFRAASGGTVFLDEIGEMSSRMQTRLLRVLQEGEVRPLGQEIPVQIDVRVIAATNRKLVEEVESGGFRRDLYFRLAGVTIEMPALAARMDDLLPLSRAILQRVQTEPGMAPRELGRAAIARLMAHDWPGNVRELEQSLRRAVLLAQGEVIEAADLALGDGETGGRRAALRRFDQDLVEHALRAADGNRTAAARALGISRVTLHRWIRRYGLAPR